MGRVLATAGYAVLSGGYVGSMGAVSRGAAERGGRVIGVTCAVFDPLPRNAWLTEEIKAPTMMDRLAIMIDRADGFVAVRGGIGTLSEVTLAWSLLQTRAHDGQAARAARRRLAARSSMRSGSTPTWAARLPRLAHDRRHPGAGPPALDRAPNTSRPSAPGVAGPGQEGDTEGLPGSSSDVSVG